MKTSESITKIAPALLSAQKIITFAAKDAKNEFFKKDGKASRYADLVSVIDAIKPALNDNGIVFIQSASPSDPGYLAMTTRLLHESGEWIEDTATIPLPKSDPQGYGSASTYGRRYGLAAITGLYQDDDDGNAASKIVNRESAKTIAQSVTEEQSPERIAMIRSAANSVIDAFQASPKEGYEVYSEIKTSRESQKDQEFVISMWGMLDSNIRTTIKKIGKEQEAVTAKG